MPPRRKTRKAAQAEAQAEAEEAENTSQQGDTMSPGPSATSKLFLGTLPDDVDFAALTSILPDISLETVSAENVIACFRVLLTQLDQSDAKDKEIDELKAQAERAEVEYDQALQDRESSIKDLETSNETLQSELGRVQKENGELGASCVFNIFFLFLRPLSSHRPQFAADTTVIARLKSLHVVGRAGWIKEEGRRRRARKA